MLGKRLTYRRSIVLMFVFILVTGLIAASLPRSGALAAGAPDAAVEPSGPDTPTSTIFGVQMYGNTGKDSKYFPFLVESKADWLRVGTAWSAAEPTNVTPDQYNWASADSAVAAAVDAGVNIILSIEHAPSWASTRPDGPIDKVDVSEFAKFMGALAERYDGDGVDDAPGSPVVTYFEMYNEPDRGCKGADEWGRHGDQYAAMLKAVYPAVKATNPNAKIVLGGIAFDWFSNKDDCQGTPGWPMNNGSFVFEFLDDVLTACYGAPGTERTAHTQETCFDVMNFHFYGAFATNWNRFPDANGLSVGMYEKTKYIRKKLAQYGVGDKPIFITEAGKHSNGGSGDKSATPVMQAQHVVVYFTQAKAAGVNAYTWWLLYDLQLSDYPLQTGLVTAGDPTPQKKPALDAYTTAISQIGKAKLERILTPAETGLPLKGFPTMEAYKFRRPSNGRSLGDALYVAWLNPMWGDSVKAGKPLRLPATQATVRDIFGHIVQAVDDADDGKVDNRVTINVTGAPIYIEVPAANEVNFLFLARVSR